MINKKYMVASLLVLMQVEGSLAADAKEVLVDDTPPLTLVVGNTRKAGGLKPSLGELVGQAQADFTHAKRERVISVDVASLQAGISYPHLALDFVRTSPEDLLSRLNQLRPMCIFFEWFPSCQTSSKGNNLTPLLLPALENAYKLLAPGGELIIDHMPYASSLPDNYVKAMDSLREVGASKTLIERVKATVDLHQLSTKPAVVSRLLQKADPFTLHINRGEHDEIRSCLIFHYKNNDTPFDDSACKFIKGKGHIIYKICAQFSTMFDIPKLEMVATINNGIVSSYQRKNDPVEAYWDLFEQHYYMMTRDEQIKKSLLDMGFILGDKPIEYHSINPYNRRKHAMLITAKKPHTSPLHDESARSNLSKGI